jgi:hypothetical protein
MNNPSRTEIVRGYLADNGYRPEIDDDGDVRFMKEGGNYFIHAPESDETFFRVVYPNFWPIESEEERTQVYAACNHANARVKVAKVFTVRDNVWASLELLFADDKAFEPIFERGVGLLQYAVSEFANHMRSLPGQKD